MTATEQTALAENERLRAGLRDLQHRLRGLGTFYRDIEMLLRGDPAGEEHP